MKKTLKRISPIQFGKILAAIYGLFTLIFVPFIIIFGIIGAFAPTETTGSPAAMILGGAIFIAIAAPIFYAIMGFIFGALGALVYNFAAGLVGGIEIDVE